MEININKVGKIKEANIAINGLTLIAGKNDTGKSTISKILYSTIKALKDYKNSFSKYIVRKVTNDYLISILKEYVANANTVDDFTKKCSSIIDKIRESEKPNYKSLKLSITEILSILANVKEKSNSVQLKGLVDEALICIKNLENKSEDEKYKRELNNSLSIIFSEAINNSKYREQSFFEIINNKKQIISCYIKEDTVTDTHLDELSKSVCFGNAIFVETPFVMELGFFLFKPACADVEKLIWTTGDLFDSNADMNKELLSFIQNNIFKNSILGYDKEEKSLKYQVDKDSSSLDMSNAASGIKSFSVLFSLLKTNSLNKDTLLLLDEPENHLHPEWQIKYAELVCLLVKNNFTIVINSHSPTFIHALEAYSEKYKIRDKSNFYLAKTIEDQNYSEFIDSSEEMENIYSNLIAPTDILYYGV